MADVAAPGEITALPGLPRDDDGPVFAAPWQAQAFAMTLLLHERGHVAWTEWTQRLATEIAAARARGEPDTGAEYYEHWLAALEKLVADKGLVLDAELAVRREEWATAARETAHGTPIELRRS
ncbi:MAG: nitrile hydratase accessory protein [Candidatus Rokuibacteriota bacterium]